jgi:hypothetical protein
MPFAESARSEMKASCAVGFKKPLLFVEAPSATGFANKFLADSDL